MMHSMFLFPWWLQFCSFGDGMHIYTSSVYSNAAFQRLQTSTLPEVEKMRFFSFPQHSGLACRCFWTFWMCVIHVIPTRFSERLRNTTLNLTPTFRETIYCPTLKQKKSNRNLPEALKSPFYVGHNSWALKRELTCVTCVTILWIKINLTVVRLFNWNFFFFFCLWLKIWIWGTFFFNLSQQMPQSWGEQSSPGLISAAARLRKKRFVRSFASARAWRKARTCLREACI